MDKIIETITNVVTIPLKFLYNPVKRITDNYSNFIFLFYLPRIIYLIVTSVIVILSLIGTISRGTLFHLYSVLKIIFLLFLLLISFIIVIPLFNKVNKCNKINGDSALELLTFASLLNFVPYVYDIIAMLILLGILKAYYIKSCSFDNLKPNVYAFIDLIVWGIPMLIILLCIILSFVASTFIKKANTFSNITIPFLSVYIALLIIYLVLQFIEELVANNFAYWLKLHDSATSGTNCVTDDTGDEEGLERAVNIFISILLGLIVIFVFIIQIIPFGPLPTINRQLRKFIGKVLHGISGALEPNCQYTSINTPLYS